MKKGIALLLCGLLFSVALFASGKAEEPSGASDAMTGTITLYTSETLTDVQGYVDAFEKSHPGAKVEIFRLGTTELVARLMSELKAGSTPADVVWFADMALFEQLASDGTLMKINPPEAANVPKQYVYFDGKAYEVRLIYQIIAYNTKLVTKKVTGWSDLLDPQFKGRVGSASPFVSGATVTQVASVVQDSALGWNYYEQLAKNDPVITGGNGGIAQGIASGEYAIGLTIDFMARAQKDQGAPVDYVYQKEGAIYVPTPAGVLESTKNPKLATEFINYLMSVPGQKELQANGYMPVNKNVPLPEGIPSAADIKVLKTDWNFLQNNRDQILDRYAKIFGID